MAPVSYRVGESAVARIHELDLDGFTVERLLPALPPREIGRLPGEDDPRVYDAAAGRVALSVHTWLVRHAGMTMLVDTGAGNGKSRPTMPVLNQLHTPFLARLADAGVAPEAVDFVLLTHIHADHVGWNTRWNGNAWVPTFPNATVICSDREWRYGAALTAGDEVAARTIVAEAGLGEPRREPVAGVFADSMLPLEAEGRVRRIAVDGAEVLPGVRFLPTPGHSIDHAVISITAGGREALFGGDLMHHPFEISRPQLPSVFCEFPEHVGPSRLNILRHAAATGALYFSSHFPTPSAIDLAEEEGAFRWRFVEP